MTNHELVSARPPVPKVSHPSHLEEAVGTVSSSNPSWQLAKWPLGMEEGGKELVKPEFACLFAARLIAGKTP